MDVAILGKGRMGATLARLWAERGHRVVLGVRDPADPEALAFAASIAGGLRALDVPAAIRAARVVVLAIPWREAEGVVAASTEWRGRVLVDCTNPVAPGLGGLLTEKDSSAAERLAKAAPGARVVKALNVIGAARLTRPSFDGVPATIPICGDDPDAKRLVTGLVEELGFEVVDAGPLERARLLEPLALLWIQLARRPGVGVEIGFKLLREGQGAGDGR